VASAIFLGVVLAGAGRGTAAEIPKCAGLQGFHLLECERQVQQTVQPKPNRLHPHFPRQPGDPEPARPIAPAHEKCAVQVDPLKWAECIQDYNEAERKAGRTPRPEATAAKPTWPPVDPRAAERPAPQCETAQVGDFKYASCR
jgi:hypothetical protein